MSNEKDELRKSFTKIRNEILFRDEKNCKIREKVLQLLSRKDCETVFSYVSIGNEVDTRLLIENMLSSGLKVFVPHTLKDEMFPTLLLDVDNLKKADKKGNIYDNPLVANCLRNDYPSVTIVPMLAFNSKLYRLGYGGGYYDRYLKNADTLKIGLAYDEQETNELIKEKHDEQLDCIVTPTRILWR